VGETAELAGVTVKTLHHYDQVCLLRPSARSHAGYRLYTHADLLRLQEILVWRRLGFALADVQALMDNPTYDREHALRRQHALLGEQVERLDAARRAVSRALQALEAGRTLKETEMFEGFDPDQYAEEAQQRWGQTPAFREAQRRTGRYNQATWSSIRAEADAIASDFAALLADGSDAASNDAVAVAERHRQHITRWFYDCSAQMHARLGEMYEADPRFRAYWNDRADGLARFVHHAIDAKSQSSNARA
jgi:DNA-binding transcriptional MerR regulator